MNFFCLYRESDKLIFKALIYNVVLQNQGKFFYFKVKEQKGRRSRFQELISTTTFTEVIIKYLTLIGDLLYARHCDKSSQPLSHLILIIIGATGTITILRKLRLRDVKYPMVLTQPEFGSLRFKCSSCAHGLATLHCLLPPRTGSAPAGHLVCGPLDRTTAAGGA